jgi:hypothetical protein
MLPPDTAPAWPAHRPLPCHQNPSLPRRSTPSHELSGAEPGRPGPLGGLAFALVFELLAGGFVYGVVALVHTMFQK